MSKKKLKKLNAHVNDGGAGAEQATTPKVDRSPTIPQKTKLRNELHIYERPMTENQKAFLSMALDKNVKMIIISGPAGTSKSWLSVLASLHLMNQKKVSDILYVRSVVESADVKMGFLPGEKEDKMSPYVQPLMDKLDELLPKDEIKYLQGEDRLQGFPVGYLRGLSWNAKAVIGDEMQNCSKKELITLMTRIGEFSKLFLIGDPSQSDIGLRSGFQDIYDLFDDDESRVNGIYTFKFTEEDIVRSKLVQFIATKVKNIV